MVLFSFQMQYTKTSLKKQHIGRDAMKIGYIRVSTQEQNTLCQEVLMERLGVEQVFIDKVSGKNTNAKRTEKFAPAGSGPALFFALPDKRRNTSESTQRLASMELLRQSVGPAHGCSPGRR